MSATTGFPPSTPYTLSLDYGAINEELVDVTGVAGPVLTVTRGVDGTSATTHSSGAFVRHVSSARDFTESRAHENATTGIHGLAGGSALVGTTDTQTLLNKSLTSPTITGTVAGSASYTTPTLTTPTSIGLSTFTGNVDVNGTVAGTAQLDVTGAASQTASLQRWLDNSATTLASVTASGLVNGNRGADFMAPSSSGVAVIARGVASQTGDLQQWKNTGGTNLAKVSATGVTTVTELIETTPSGWIAASAPTWTTSSGLHSPSLGNAAVLYQYKVISGTLFVSLSIAFGSTTNFGAGATTADNWLFGLPGGLTASTAFRGAQLITGFGRATASAPLTSPFAVKIDSTGTKFTLDTAGGQQDGNALSDSGTMDSLTPFVWANGDVMAFSATVPIT